MIAKQTIANWPGANRPGAAAWLLVLAAFALPASAQTVTLPALLGVTGPVASIDAPAAEGFKMAVKDINDAGGLTVAGKHYQLDGVVEDVQGKPDQAVGMARRLVAEGKTPVIMGPIVSSVSVPTFAVTQPKLVQIVPATIGQQFVGTPGKELLFDTTNPQFTEHGMSAQYMEWLAKNVFQPKGIKKIAILMANDAFGQLELDFFPPRFKQAGIEITGQETFDPKAADFSALITKLKAGNPDALFWGYLDEAGKTIVRQSLELGLTRQFIAAPGPSGGSYAAQADKLDLAVWPSVLVALDDPSPRMQKFVAAYEARIGRKITPGDQFSIYLYDPVHMAAKAMEAAGSVSDPVKIAHALRGMTYSGVMNWRVDDKGQFHSDWDIGSMVRGGKITWTTIPVQ